MKFIKIIFLFISIYEQNFIELYNYFKCFSSNDFFDITQYKIDHPEFTLSLWLRADNFTNDAFQKNFLKLSTSAGDVIISSIKSTTLYQLYYESNLIGQLSSYEGKNQEDIKTKNNAYFNWKHLSISFLRSSKTLTVFMDSVITKVLAFDILLTNATLMPCLAGNLVDSLYMAHIIIFNKYYSLPAEFYSLAYNPLRTELVFSLLDSRNKNELFSENLKEKKSKLKILKKFPQNLLLEKRTSPNILLEKKIFFFSLKHFSLINNSYSVSMKILIINPLTNLETYLLYSRISSNSDPLSDNFIPDKLSFNLAINNKNMTTKLFNKQIEEMQISQNIYTTSSFIFSILFKRGINLDQAPNYTNLISTVSIGLNDSLNISAVNKNLDLTHFSYTDKHIFGFPAIVNNYSNIFFISYILNIGQAWQLNLNTFDPLTNEPKLSNFPKFSQKMNNDSEISNELSLTPQVDRNSSYCGLVTAVNCNYPSGTNRLTPSYFSKYILENRNDFTTCQDNLVDETIYYCDSSAMTNSVVLYNNEDVSQTTLDFLQNNLIAQMDQNKDFLIMIIININVSTFSYEIVKHYLTSIHDFITLTFLKDYFIFLPNSTFTYKIFFISINPLDFVNVQIYPNCIKNLNKYKMNDILNKCVSSCPIGSYADDEDICFSCPKDCISCTDGICTECQYPRYLYKGECFNTQANCIDLFPNCLVCNINDQFICAGCVANYNFIPSLNSCELNCLFNDLNCLSCVVGQENICAVCLNHYLLINGVCKKNCLLYEHAKTCIPLFEAYIETCSDSYIVDFEQNKCLFNCSENCLSCINNESDISYICKECKKDFYLYQGKCVESYCFEDFCLKCQQNISEDDCKKCFSCKNLLLFQEDLFSCGDIIPNCKNCSIDGQNHFKCLICLEGFFLNESICEEKNLNIFLEDFIYQRNCKEGYILDKNKECKKSTYLCDIGCFSCFTEKSQCQKCNENLIYLNALNKCASDQFEELKVQEISQEFKKNTFKKENLNCDEILNNLTIINEVNHTIYNNKDEFFVFKNTEFFFKMINCTANPQDCLELNENFKKYDKINCDKKIVKTFEFLTTNYTNITTFSNQQYCEKSQKNHKCEESINCLDINCFSYEEKKKCVYYNNFNICNNFYPKNKEINNYGQYQSDQDVLCQTKKMYHNSHYLNCQKECILNFEYENKFLLKNILDNTKVIFDFDSLKSILTKKVKVFSKNRGEVIHLEFDLNFPELLFELQSNFIKEAYNCQVTEKKIYLLKNTDYAKNNPLLLIFNRFINGIIVSNFIIINSLFPNFVPDNIFEILQFNEFFTFLYYLDIKGGSFFNYFIPFYKEIDDTDIIVSPTNELIFSFEFCKHNLTKLIKQSIIDYFLFSNIIIIFILKLLMRIFKKRINQEFQKRQQILILIKKESKSRNDKNLNSCERFRKSINLFYLNINYAKLVNKYYVSIWNMYILYLPHYILIFMRKVENLDWKFQIFYFFYFLITKLFLVSKFFIDFKIIMKYYYMKRIKKISFENLESYEEEIYLYHQRIFYFFFSIFKVFIINFYFNQYLSLILIIFIDILNIGFFFIYTPKRMKLVSFIKMVPLIFFNIWLLLVIIRKNSFYEFEIPLNIFYVLANLTKMLEFCYLIYKLQKIKKKQTHIRNSFKMDAIKKLVIR